MTGKPVAVKQGPRRAGDPPALVAASDKARADLGWEPAWTDLRAIVKSAWDWHRAHPDGYPKG